MQHATQVRILEALLSNVEQGNTVDAGCQVLNPTEVYTDPAIAAREWQTFFREHPQIIGLSGDLPNPGSYLTMEDFGVPILATRDPDGEFRAFVNACRHRGTRVANDTRGETKRFVCPFHGWTYKTDGALAGVPEVEHFGQVDASCHGLVELPSVEKHGLLWVHPQPAGTIDTEALLGELGDEFDSWDITHHIYRGNYVLDKRMNWKLANDTFGETYHFSRLHRKTLGNLFNGEALVCEPLGRNHRAAFPSKKILRLRDKPQADWRIDHVATVLYFLFPNVQITVSDRQVTLFRIYPLGSEPCRSVTYMSHYFSQDALDLIEGGQKTVIDETNVYDKSARDGNAIVSPEAAIEIVNSTVEMEDYRMGESTQRTVESGLLPHLVFGRNEAPLHHFHNQFRDALGLSPLQRVD